MLLSLEKHTIHYIVDFKLLLAHVFRYQWYNFTALNGFYSNKQATYRVRVTVRYDVRSGPLIRLFSLNKCKNIKRSRAQLVHKTKGLHDYKIFSFLCRFQNHIIVIVDTFKSSIIRVDWLHTLYTYIPLTF